MSGKLFDAALKIGKAEQALIEATEFSIDIFTGDKIFTVPAHLIRLLPSRLGLFQDEFRNKDDIQSDPRWPKWTGGQAYYKDTGLMVFAKSNALSVFYATRHIIEAVQATARLKAIGTLIWKVQFEGVIVFRAGESDLGPYTMKYMSGRTLAGPSRPIAASSDALETALHHYFSR